MAERQYKEFEEYGRIGQYRYAGIFYEEFLYELRGRKGVEVYKEMADNDDIVGAILFAMEMLMRQVAWDVTPGGNTDADREAAEFIKSCMNDMTYTWMDTVSEILSFLTFGWSYHEIVYKRRMGDNKDSNLRSKFNDGLIGWKKLPIRSQDTLWKWEYKENSDELLGLQQMAPPDFQIRSIPIEKALHFVTRGRKADPQGRSVLRNAYRNYYFKRRIQEIEGIGMERDLAGLPTLTPPEGTNLFDASDPEMVDQLNRANKIVQNVRRDQLEGVVLPYGWKFELLSTGGRRQFDTNQVIERYDSRMAMTVLADFVLLGHQTVGSFALSSDKTKLFSVAIGAFLDVICNVFNDQGIPRLINLNGEHFKNITTYPKLIHGDLESVSLADISTFIKDMTGVGILLPDEGLEDYVRRVGDLPERLNKNIDDMPESDPGQSPNRE